MVLGIVFDGDGDRCFLLIYNPFKDFIFVLGGDALSFLQAKFLYEKYYSGSKYFFINTIYFWMFGLTWGKHRYHVVSTSVTITANCIKSC